MFVVRLLNNNIQFKRTMSTNRFVTMSTEEGIATVSLNKRPVNSICLEMIQELKSTLDQVEKNECKAVILTSGLPTIYSAGLDLNEFHKADAKRLSTFWKALQDSFLQLYGSPYISTAAINGYTGAGACVISLMCDYRVMVESDKAKIGLNDTQVGIIPTDWVRELMTRTVGTRQAELAMSTAKMYSVDEALKINLVDDKAIDQKEAIEKCKKYIRSLDAIPVKTRIGLKKEIREEFIKRFVENYNASVESFLRSVLDPEIQKHIATYVDDIKKKKK